MVILRLTSVHIHQTAHARYQPPTEKTPLIPAGSTQRAANLLSFYRRGPGFQGHPCRGVIIGGLVVTSIVHLRPGSLMRGDPVPLQRGPTVIGAWAKGAGLVAASVCDCTQSGTVDVSVTEGGAATAGRKFRRLSLDEHVLRSIVTKKHIHLFTIKIGGSASYSRIV